MMNTLSDYVLGRLNAGRPAAEVGTELMAVGWPKETADAAYREALVKLGIPLPEAGSAQPVAPAGSSAPKAATADVALSLFSFILLGTVVSALISLCFTLINRAFPELHELPGEYLAVATASAMHRSIASLAIAFPLYVIALSWWLKRFAGARTHNETRLTKWLTYLVLLLASVTIVCDLITLVYALLQGEMTPRFLWKVAVVLGMAGLVFGFYWLERRAVQFGKAVPAGAFKGFGWVASGLVAVTVAAGYLSAGSPQTARRMASDAERSQDLVALSRCLQNYAGALGQLPASLQQLERTSAYADCPTHDRQTRERFAYRVVVPARSAGAARLGEFELCAQFALASTRSGAAQPGNAQNWFDHPAGRSCRISEVQLGGLDKK